MIFKLHRLRQWGYALGLLLLAAGLSGWFGERAEARGKDAAAKEPTPVRAADAACATCHAEITARYLQSPMAHGSGVAGARLLPGEVTPAASGVRYRVDRGENGPELRYARGGEHPLEGAHPLAYFLGSGHLGTTYLYWQEGFLLESPVAFYAHPAAYDMAPGLAASRGLPAALPMTPGCMRCHMSGVQATDAGTRNHFSGLPFAHGGITCEACHGDAAAHLASGGRAAMLNPMKLSAAARDSVCVNCHLEGDASVERRGRSVLDYRPGEDIRQDITYFVLRGGDSTERSVSETEELNTSRCKRMSGDRMSCMSCHDPHGSPPPAQRVAFYRGKCLACHADPGFAQTHFPATPDCTGCHMPRGGAQDTPHVAWTDHRLRQRPTAPVAEPAGSVQATELTPVLGEAGVTERDRALACYKLMMKGQAGFALQAWTRLNAVVAADGSDAATLLALASMNQMQGRSAAAEALFRRALQLRPGDLDANNDLGILLAGRGDWTGARELWQQSFARNADVESLGVNLAVAQCRTGDAAASAATLKQVLRFSPDAAQARDRLAQIGSGQERCTAASGAAGAARTVDPNKPQSHPME